MWWFARSGGRVVEMVKRKGESEIEDESRVYFFLVSVIGYQLVYCRRERRWRRRRGHMWRSAGGGGGLPEVMVANEEGE
ncbi:hypothetical protein Tco_0432640 [Tanacetum coccineum]